MCERLFRLPAQFAIRSRHDPATTPSPPSREHRFTFGLWTVGNPGRDPFGGPTREPLDPVDSVRKLAELGAWGISPARRGPRPVRLLRRRARPHRRALQGGARGDRPGRRHGDDEPVRPAGVQGRRVHVQRPRRAPRRDRQGDALDRPRRRAGRRGLRVLGRPRGHRGRRREGPARRARPLPRGDQRAVPTTSVGQGYDLRFAIEPKPNEPRGDVFLPTVGHALHFISTLDRPEHGRREPGGRARDDGGPVVPPRASAQALWAGKLFHVDLNAQRIGRYDQDFRFGAEDLKEAFLLVRLLERAGYAGPRHFDAHAYRNEDAEGVWDFARGCMRTYLALAEKARHFDALPEVQEALAAASTPELAEPSTAGAGEADALKAEADAARRARAARLRQRGARPAAGRGAARRPLSCSGSSATSAGSAKTRRSASADAPRTAASAPSADVHDARARPTRPTSTRASSSSSQPGSEPRRERREVAADDDAARVEQVRGRRDADAEPAAGVGERRRARARRRPRARSASSADARAGIQAGGAQQRAERDARLEAAAVAARADARPRGRRWCGRARRRTRARRGTARRRR